MEQTNKTYPWEKLTPNEREGFIRHAIYLIDKGYIHENEYTSLEDLAKRIAEKKDG